MAKRELRPVHQALTLEGLGLHMRLLALARAMGGSISTKPSVNLFVATGATKGEWERSWGPVSELWSFSDDGMVPFSDPFAGVPS